MAKYVKFLRGTPEAFARLKHKDSDTLYFIYEEDESTGELYLGSKLIAGADCEGNHIGVNTLSDLKDVLLSQNLNHDSVLVYDTNAVAWVNKSLEDLIFVGATSRSAGLVGLVPAPEYGQIGLFLRSDGTWAIPPAIQATDEYLQFDEGKLSLKDIPVSKVINLDGILNNGQKTPGGYHLISQKDKDKLDALVLEEGKLEISGTVSAYKVTQLDEWITEHANIVPGLSEQNFTAELNTKLIGIQEGAEKNYIRSVSNEFTVSDEGQLNINSIGISKVSDLKSALDAKANRNELIALSNDVGELTERLTWTIFNE